MLRHALALASRDPARALEELRRGLAVARHSGHAATVVRFSRHAGVIALHLGDFDGAIAHCEEALAIDSTDPYDHLALGSVLQAAGRPREARAALRIAYEMALGAEDAELAECVRSALAKGDEDSG